MKIENTKESKRLAPGQVWMSSRFDGTAVRCTLTLLIKQLDDNFTWFVLRINDKGRVFTHTPALNFIGNELDEDDEEMSFVRIA